MNRYNPTPTDLLIETVDGRCEAHIVTDVDAPNVTYERPDGSTITTQITSLRRDLHRGRFTVEPKEASCR